MSKNTMISKINERKTRKALNFQIDEVRNRLFDISLAISNSLYNKTISNYETNKYLQEVRKYKRTHLWDNQITEMSEKLITQLKIILSGNYLLSHKYSTRLRNIEIQNDSDEDTAYGNIDDMIDYFRRNKSHGKVSNYLRNKKESGRKSVHCVKTNAVKNKRKTGKRKKISIESPSRKQKHIKNKEKAKSLTTKTNNKSTMIDLLHVPAIDCSASVFDVNMGKNSNTNNTTTIKCIKSLEKLGSTNDTVFALDLSRETTNTITVDSLLDKEYKNLHNNNITYQNTIEQNLVENKKLDVLDYSFDYQGVEATINLCSSPIFNEMNINNEKDKKNKSEEIMPLDLSRNVEKTNNKHSLRHLSQQAIAQLDQNDSYNKRSEIKTLLTHTNINLYEMPQNAKQFHNPKSLLKQITKKRFNDKSSLEGTTLKCKQNRSSNKNIKKKIILPKNDSKKKNTPKKKEMTDIRDCTRNLNNAISNEAFSCINSLEYFRKADDEECCINMELPEEFWNNFDLPPNWDDQDFIL